MVRGNFQKSPQLEKTAEARTIVSLTLCNRIRNGDRKAEQEIVALNRRLAVLASNQYLGRGVDKEDLIQCGCLGILEAAKRYDCAKAAFSTYAMFWIRAKMNREITENGRMIRLPANVIDSRNKYVKKRRKGLKLSKSELAAYESQILTSTIRIDQDADKNEDRKPIGNTIESKEMPQDMAYLEGEVSSVLNGFVAAIKNPVWREVITARFGLGTGTISTLREIGDSLGISRERVRQIERLAIGEIRDIARRNGLKLEDLAR